MAAHAVPRITPEEYLALERAAEFRSEYLDGIMYAMAGASPVHIQLTANLTIEFGMALRKKPCYVLPNEMRVRVGSGRLYCYPDLVIACEPRKYADDQKDTLLNPIVVVEVLSPSTEGYDRGLKSQQYRTIDSLQTYVLVSQSEPRVEIYRRQDSGTWLFSEVIGMEGTCVFEDLGGESVRIPMSEIYAKVEFEAAAALPPPPEERV